MDQSHNDNDNLPIIPVNPVTNQISPDQDTGIETLIVESVLKSTPHIVICPFCKVKILTRIERSCSCANICCCLGTTCVCWIIFQGCRKKDLNCYNADHYCTNCDKLIYEYKAC